MKGDHTLVSGQVDADSLPHTLSLPARTTLEQSLVRTDNTIHSGCRVLRSGGLNHSKPSVFIVFLHLDRTNPSYPEFILPQSLGGCILPLGWVYHPTYTKSFSCQNLPYPLCSSHLIFNSCQNLAKTSENLSEI